jgi:SulP family sulfate permease
MVYNGYYTDEISFSSLKKDVTGYSWSTFRADLIAGLSVAMVTVPQAMGYALIAGLPLLCGLYTAIFATIIAAIFCASRHVVVGPSNALAILIQTGIAEILYTHYRDLTGLDKEMMAFQIMTQICLLVGLFQILAAACNLGRLVQFVSHSVVVGYVSGVAIALAVNQMFLFLGMPTLQGVYSLYERGLYIFTHLPEIHLPTALVGFSSLALVIFLNRFNKKIPWSFIVLIAACLAVHFLGLTSYSEVGIGESYSDLHPKKVMLVGDVGQVSSLILYPSFPFFDTSIMNTLLPVAFAIALLSILETSAVAKSISASSGQLLSNNQEILGLGIANLFCCFAGGMPCSGSPSRSALIYRHGAITRFAAVYNALFVVVILVLFGFFLEHIPLPALAALLLVNVVNIVNKKQFLLCLKATNSDRLVLLTTLAACLFFSLDIAFYIGIIMSITLYLKTASVPHVMECRYNESSGSISRMEDPNREDDRQVRMIDVRGELFFGAVDLFQSTLKSITDDNSNIRVIILRLKNARDLDATACLALYQLHHYLKDSNRLFIACALTQQSWQTLNASGLVDELGHDNLFLWEPGQQHLSEQKALQRANEWLNKNPRITKIDVPVETRIANYDIASAMSGIVLDSKGSLN